MIDAMQSVANPLRRLSDYFQTQDIKCDGAFTTLDEAETVHPSSLVYCQNLEYARIASANSNVTAVITTSALATEVGKAAVLISPDPRLTFFRLYAKLRESGHLGPPMEYGRGEACNIHATASVSPRTRLGDRVQIAANAVIEAEVQVGDDCRIGPGAIVGAEGLLTIWQEDGTPLVVEHAGSVVIGRGVVVLAGAVIARALFRSPTTIGDYCQIGIMANIGHGARIGRRSVIAGNCVVAGRCKIGEFVRMGASCSVAQAIRVGDRARIHMGSVVVDNVEPHQIVSGNFAMPHSKTMRAYLRDRG